MWIPGSALVIDRHVIAGISITGTVCDVMGGLYLAYDLLGSNINRCCPLVDGYSDPYRHRKSARPASR